MRKALFLTRKQPRQLLNCVYRCKTTKMNIPLKAYPNQLFTDWMKYSSKIAMVNGINNQNYLYSDVIQAIHCVSSALLKRGYGKYQMVSMVAPNCPEYVIIQHAVMSTGAAVSLTNPNETIDELKAEFLVSRPSLIFTTSALADKVAEAVKELNCCQDIYLFDTTLNSTSAYKSTAILFQDNGDASSFLRDDIITDPRNHLALLPYSSGTTGLPKGVMLSHYNLVANLIQLHQARKIVESKDVVLGVLPMHHLNSLVWQNTALYRGSKLITLPNFEPETFLKCIQTHKVNILHLVPPLILFLLNHPLVKEYDLSSIEKVMSTAAPLSKEVEDNIMKMFANLNINVDIWQGYGATELSPVSHIAPRKDLRAANKQSSVGRIVPGMEFKIVDPVSGIQVGENVPGELWLRGPNIMMGYFNNPHATADCMTVDGWFKTGDILYYDHDGYFFVVDRLQELINFNGHSIAPSELEGVLLTHPGVNDAAVIGMDHEISGQVPLAFVVKKDPNLTENELLQHVSARLSQHKQLRGGIIFVKEIPKSSSGKILKKDLRDLLKKRKEESK